GKRPDRDRSPRPQLLADAGLLIGRQSFDRLFPDGDRRPTVAPGLTRAPAAFDRLMRIARGSRWTICRPIWRHEEAGCRIKSGMTALGRRTDYECSLLRALIHRTGLIILRYRNRVLVVSVRLLAGIDRPGPAGRAERGSVVVHRIPRLIAQFFAVLGRLTRRDRRRNAAGGRRCAGRSRKRNRWR